MRIKIQNCKNIDTAELEVFENKLNIKYAMNGTGKSTIAKAIAAFVKGSEDLSDLVPFKHREKDSMAEFSPEVTGHETITSVALFDEEYLEQFTFKPDELLTNSFEVFIKTPDYDKRISQIEELTKQIKETLKDSETIKDTVNDFSSFISSFGKATKAGYSASSPLARGLGSGNKIENIPDGLSLYSDYLKSDKKVPWLSWQIKGTEYLGLSKHCPFCTSEVKTKKQIIEKVKSEYDPKSIEHLANVLACFSKVEEYFSEEVKSRVRELAKSSGSPSKEEFSYLVQVKDQIGILREKLLDLQALSFFSLRDVEKVLDFFQNLKIKLDFIPLLKSKKAEELVSTVNSTLDAVIEKAGTLQGEVNQQKRLIERIVAKHSGEINQFLSNAGYKYKVIFESEENKYRLRLKHLDYAKSLSKGDQYLSFGEKNAFALVLFMYEAISQNAGLVILDDPISSFDRNKKFALIDMLFMREGGLRNRTVLMLTHDFEPIIDMMYTFYRNFCNRLSVAFLQEISSVLEEKNISKSDIKSFTEVCEENIARHSETIVKLIHLRRYFEIVNDKGLPYELLSNLFHKRSVPYKITNNNKVDLTDEQIEEATEDIRKWIPSFDYSTNLENINNIFFVKDLYKSAGSSYEKLQIFRIATGEAVGDNVLKKYINETFHIENDFVMQLNPCLFPTTPQYIVDKCDEEMELL